MSSELPPGPRGVVEVGRFFRAFTRDPSGHVLAMRERWGDVVGFRLMNEAVVVLNDPALIGDVLLDKDGVWMKDRILRSLSVILGTGLLTSEGDLWRKQRKLIAPSLTKKHIATYADAMVKSAADYADALEAGRVRDVHDDMSRVTLEIVVATLFGTAIRGGHDEVGRAIDTVMNDFAELVHSWRRLMPGWVPFKARRRMTTSIKTIDDIVFDVIQERKKSGKRGDDLLSRLLEARDEGGAAMSDAQLRDEAVTLFVAGHETTANALSFALMLLGDHPSTDAALAEEIGRVLGDRKATADDVGALKLTDAVMKEAMRLYPPAHIIGREAMVDVELGSHRLAKGTGVVFSPWAMHHDGRYWPDPFAFKPERWLDGSTSSLPKNVYIPFGGGPRVCVGSHFATMESVLVLATLLQRVRFERTSAEPIRTQAAVTLRPLDSIPMRVVRRASRVKLAS